MSNRSNTNSLFWENVLSRLKVGVGVILLITGFIVGLIFIVNNSFGYGLFSVGFLGIGIYSIVKGKQQELYYKKNTGYIVYQN